jgi:PAS domain S-box-containing protein
MKRFRLFPKALAILVLLFGTTALATAVFSAWILERNLIEQYEGKGKAIANGIAGASVEFLLFRDPATIQAMIDQYLEEGKIQGVAYLFVVDRRGAIISHTFAPGIPDEVRGLEGDRHETTVRPVRIAGRDFIDIAAPILASEAGQVHVGMDRELIGHAIKSAIVKQLALMGLLFLLSILGACIVVNRLASPLRHLADYAKQVASGDAASAATGEPSPELRSIAAATDEVGQLAQAFQHMVQEISNREQRLHRAQEELRALNDTLEQRVAERSAAAEQRARELIHANEQFEREAAERSQAEAELAQERYLLGALMNNIPDSIYFKDTASRFLRINRALADRFGLGDPAAAAGKTDYDFFTEEHARPAHADEQQVMRTGEPLVGKEEKETWADGRERWVLTTKMPLPGRDGSLLGTFGISRDITRRKQAQMHLEASERRYRQLTEASLDAIVVADEQQRILLFNPAAERTFGYAAAEIMGQPLAQLIPTAYADAHAQGFRRFLATRQGRIVGRTVELRGRRKDGTEFPLELSLSALDLGGEMQFLGAIRDLTERNRLRAMMVQTEKLASIGQLSAGVAHEINNPLAYVGSNLAVLERDVKGLMRLLGLYEQARDRLAAADRECLCQAEALAEEIDLPYIRDNLDRLLSRTRDGVQRVARIVSSMRSLARTAPPELEQTPIPKLVEISLEMIAGQLRRRNIAVELDYNGAAHAVSCVPTQISQVLLNLLVNALHAIESTARGDGGRIRIATRDVGPELCIEIADNGCGIDPQVKSRLFDPFFTTKPVGEGTGLGLSIAHEIITGHGGRIEVESQPGVGSTFRIFLPLEANAHAR